jgi:hypothetical protein
MRSSSVMPANSAVSASLRLLVLWRSRSVSRRVWSSSVNLKRLSPRTVWMRIPASIQKEGCTMVWVIMGVTWVGGGGDLIFLIISRPPLALMRDVAIGDSGLFEDSPVGRSI